MNCSNWQIKLCISQRPLGGIAQLYSAKKSRPSNNSTTDKYSHLASDEQDKSCHDVFEEPSQANFQIGKRLGSAQESHKIGSGRLLEDTQIKEFCCCEQVIENLRLDMLIFVPLGGLGKNVDLHR